MRYLNYAGYLAIPLAFLIHFWLAKGHDWEPIATFFLAGLGVIPLAHLMGRSTEHLSERAGPTWGGLLNASFGNATELIIGIIALTKGLTPIVKATLTGSILGNLLLVAGAAMVVGGWRRHEQSFSPAAAQSNAGLLALAIAGMLFPAIFHFTAAELHDATLIHDQHAVSIGTSVILIVVYALGLLFTLKTHAHLFSPAPSESPEDPSGTASLHEGWSVRRSVAMLLLASAGIAIVAELLVGSAELMAHHLGWSDIFVGVILLAIIGNAAEHSTAILLAHRNDMDTAMTISYQSSLQIALFATPVLVLISALLPWLGMPDAQFMDLIFSPMEVVAVILSVGIVVILGMDGKTNWFEGALLMALYTILAISFFYLPATPLDAPHDSSTAPIPSLTTQP
jgi:Ca2+:H+ antiporter